MRKSDPPAYLSRITGIESNTKGVREILLLLHTIIALTDLGMYFTQARMNGTYDREKYKPEKTLLWIIVLKLKL